MRGNFVKGGYELWSEKLLNFYCYSCLVFLFFVCFVFCFFLQADDYDDIGMTPWTDRSKKQPTATQRQTAIDITAEDLLPRLSVQHVADLVLLSMVSCCLTVTSLPLGI